MYIRQQNASFLTSPISTGVTIMTMGTQTGGIATS